MSELQALVQDAAARRTPLLIRAGGSKAFYGRRVQGEPLDVRGHAGIVSYEPSELVVTARCGTPLVELENLLAQHGQMLSFEPPHFHPPPPPGEGWGESEQALISNGRSLTPNPSPTGGGEQSTVGGMVAAGLSGPRRPWSGSLRDAVLGVKLLTGRGEVLTFGGQVMKNVAGYDVSRLLAGSLGSLGVILEVSLRVLPRPPVEITLVREADASAVEACRRELQSRPWPLSATLHDGQRLWLRLSGAEAGVTAARAALGGEAQEDNALWRDARDQRLAFFQTDRPLWRLSLPPATPPLDLPGAGLSEWGGAQRWLISDAAPARIRAAATLAGGHATLFRGHDGQGEVFHPLAAPLMTLHRRIKAAFDPAGILNPGVMVGGL